MPMERAVTVGGTVVARRTEAGTSGGSRAGIPEVEASPAGIPGDSLDAGLRVDLPDRVDFPAVADFLAAIEDLVAARIANADSPVAVEDQVAARIANTGP